MTHDAVVVGAGLAGLAAARQMAIHGLEVIVLEAADQVGGRVRTDRIDGYQLDRGFQLYNPAYPEAARVLDHGALDLQALTPGVIVSIAGGSSRLGDPRARPGWAFDSVSMRTGSLLSKGRFAQYAWRVSRTPARKILSSPDFTAAVALRSAGVDDLFLERVLRPFLSGVFLEPNLETSRRFMDLVLTSFVRGTPSLPRLGMQAIPDQLRDALPSGSVLCGARVKTVQPGVITTEDQQFRAPAIVVATDPIQANNLLPQICAPAGRAVTTWYHRPDTSGTCLAGGEGVLVVDGQARGPVINTVVMSNAAASYAPAGHALVSSSVLGIKSTAADETEVRSHLSLLYGVDTSRWEVMGSYAIPYALPAMMPGLSVPQPVRITPGLYVCGDYRETASIQGAMMSGRRVADAVIADLGRR